MQSVALSGPRALRLGVVQGGRIISEQRFAAGRSVKLGSSERADLVVPELGREKLKFESLAGGFSLEIPAGVRARVSNGASVEDLIGPRRVELGPLHRGKLQIGATTILFQLVQMPPKQARPALPVSVLNRNQVDWATTLIAGFSFLFHFLALGALYSDWADPVLDEGVTVNGVVDQLSALSPAPLETTPADTTATEPGDKPEPKIRSDKSPPDNAGGPASNPSASASATLERELEAIGMETLGVLQSDMPATAGVLRDGEVPISDLNRVAAANAGVGAPGIRIASSGPVRPGQRAELGQIGETRRQGSDNTGSVQAVRRPVGTTITSSPTTTGIVSDAPAVVAGMRPGFSACYRRALESNPDAQGSIRLTIRVGPGGEVSGVSAAASGNLPGSMVSCVRNRASAAQFSAPEGGSAVVIVPASFINAGLRR